MIKKIVIPSSNTKAVELLEALSKKKAAIKKDLELRSIAKAKEDAAARTRK